MMDQYFPIIQGTLLLQPNNVQKCYQRRLIPLAFVPLVLENELQYHGLAVHINSGDDGSTLSKNFGELLPGNSRDDRAYVFVLGENQCSTCIHRAVIQKCHAVLLC